MIYRKFEPEFLNWICRNFQIDAELARDIFQEAIVALYINIKKKQLSELSSSIRTYLFAIGKNLVLKHVQRFKEVGIDSSEPELPPHWDTDVFQLSERQQHIADALKRLGEPCQSLLRFFYFDNFALEAIAERLGYKNESVARAQKVRCIKALKELMSKINTKD